MIAVLNDVLAHAGRVTAATAALLYAQPRPIPRTPPFIPGGGSDPSGDPFWFYACLVVGGGMALMAALALLGGTFDAGGKEEWRRSQGRTQVIFSLVVLVAIAGSLVWCHGNTHWPSGSPPP